MTDPLARASLLPPNATARERAVEGADAAVGDLDVAQVTRVRDPAEAPAAYLPYLAWERSVDVWDPAWPEATKRAVVEAAPEVHRHKGTVHAVEVALGALGVDADVVEWWQQAPRGAPYTFKVTAYARARLYDGPLLDARLIKVVFASILHAKPVSRAFDLTVTATLQSTLSPAAAVLTRSRVRQAASPAPSGELATALGLAPAALARVRVAVAAVPVLPPP